nr:hypothetical protein [Streptomyces sp. FBKL.4005]
MRVEVGCLIDDKEAPAEGRGRLPIYLGLLHLGVPLVDDVDKEVENGFQYGWIAGRLIAKGDLLEVGEPDELSVEQNHIEGVAIGDEQAGDETVDQRGLTGLCHTCDQHRGTVERRHSDQFAGDLVTEGNTVECADLLTAGRGEQAAERRLFEDEELDLALCLPGRLQFEMQPGHVEHRRDRPEPAGNVLMSPDLGNQERVPGADARQILYPNVGQQDHLVPGDRPSAGQGRGQLRVNGSGRLGIVRRVGRRFLHQGLGRLLGGLSGPSADDFRFDPPGRVPERDQSAHGKKYRGRPRQPRLVLDGVQNAQDDDQSADRACTLAVDVLYSVVVPVSLSSHTPPCILKIK